SVAGSRDARHGHAGFRMQPHAPRFFAVLNKGQNDVHIAKIRGDAAGIRDALYRRALLATDTERVVVPLIDQFIWLNPEHADIVFDQPKLSQALAGRVGYTQEDASIHARRLNAKRPQSGPR